MFFSFRREIAMCRLKSTFMVRIWSKFTPIQFCYFEVLLGLSLHRKYHYFCHKRKFNNAIDVYCCAVLYAFWGFSYMRFRLYFVWNWTSHFKMMDVFLNNNDKYLWKKVYNLSHCLTRIVCILCINNINVEMSKIFCKCSMRKKIFRIFFLVC